MAAEKYSLALEIDPRHAAARLGLAELALQEGDLEGARGAASAVPVDAPEHQTALAVLARITFMSHCKESREKPASAARAAQQPDDLDAQYDLACCLAAEQDYRRALDLFLRILERDKHYRDDAARQAMLSIFSIVGQRSDLADEYRSQMARVLY